MSGDHENTPVEIPRLKNRNGTGELTTSGSLDDLKGVPVAVAFEDSDKFANALYEQVEGTAASLGSTDSGEDLTPGNIIDILAQKVAKHGGGGGGMPPDAFKKQNKKHNWITIVLALLLGPGGAFAVIRAMDDRSKDNSREVKAMKADVDADVKPRLNKVEENVDLIRVDVSKMGKSVDDMRTEQTVIADGIEELKGENVERLKDELDEAKRELRRRRRRPR